MKGIAKMLRAGARDRLLVEVMEKFVLSFDVWATSSEQGRGALFDLVLDARNNVAVVAPLLAAKTDR